MENEIAAKTYLLRQVEELNAFITSLDHSPARHLMKDEIMSMQRSLNEIRALIDNMGEKASPL